MSTDLALSVGTLKQGIDSNNSPTITLPVTVVNRGSTGLSGGGVIDYFLSKDRALDDSDFMFATTDVPSVHGAGSTGTITLNTIAPAFVAPNIGRAPSPGDYFVIAAMFPTQRGADTNSSNNQAASTTTISVTYQFGQVGEASNVPLTVTMPDGTLVIFSLQGPGTGQVLNVDNEVIVVLFGNTTQTRLNISPVDRTQTPTIDGLIANGGLKELIADRLTIDGNLTIQGAVGQVTLANLYHSNFTIAGFGADTGIDIGQVADSSLTSQTPLRQLSVDRWRDSDLTADTISAPYITDLNSSGDFEAAVQLSTVHNGVAIEQVQIGGHITGTWVLNGGVSSLEAGSIGANFAGTIRGDINSLDVRGNAGGSLGVANIRRMTVGGNLTGATYLAGADLGSNGRLDGSDSGDDSFDFGRIGNVDIRGQMINSILAAGFATGNNIIGDSDDQLESNSFIETISVRLTVVNSFFAAANLPQQASINRETINTSGNSAFVSGSGG